MDWKSTPILDPTILFNCSSVSVTLTLNAKVLCAKTNRCNTLTGLESIVGTIADVFGNVVRKMPDESSNF